MPEKKYADKIGGYANLRFDAVCRVKITYSAILGDFMREAQQTAEFKQTAPPNGIT
jgi:hypothetical protein